MQRGRRGQVAGLARRGRFLQNHPVGDFADENLSPVGVVAGVDEPTAGVPRQSIGHGPPGGGVVGAADDQAVVVREAGVAALLLPEGINRVADGRVVDFRQPVGQGLVLELSHVAGVEVLGQQVAGLHLVAVHQDDGGVAALEEVISPSATKPPVPPQPTTVIREVSSTKVVGHGCFSTFRVGSLQSGPASRRSATDTAVAGRVRRVASEAGRDDRRRLLAGSVSFRKRQGVPSRCKS